MNDFCKFSDNHLCVFNFSHEVLIFYTTKKHACKCYVMENVYEGAIESSVCGQIYRKILLNCHPRGTERSDEYAG